MACINYKAGATWRAGKKAYFKSGSTWREAKKIWYKSGSTWKSCSSCSSQKFLGKTTSITIPSMTGHFECPVKVLNVSGILMVWGMRIFLGMGDSSSDSIYVETGGKATTASINNNTITSTIHDNKLEAMFHDSRYVIVGYKIKYEHGAIEVAGKPYYKNY